MIFVGFEKSLVINTSVTDTFRRYEQLRGRNESGGILLGKVFPNSVTIEKVTTPSIFDRYSRSFFIRSKKSAQKVINKSWFNSNGQLNYLGEWHTHCVEHPTPSPQDRKMIQNSFDTTIMEIDFLFLIIIGLSNTIWVGVQTENGLWRLALS